jgi:hypothetical protein
VARSSCCSVNTAPARRRTAARLGKIPRLLCLSSGAEDLDLWAVMACEEPEQLPGKDALEAALDLTRVLALGGSALGAGLGEGVSRSRTTMMVCSAWLRCRSLRRLSRWRVTSPDEAGIGLTPTWAATVASERQRLASDQLTRICAAVIGPSRAALAGV